MKEEKEGKNITLQRKGRQGGREGRTSRQCDGRGERSVIKSQRNGKGNGIEIKVYEKGRRKGDT